jgi:pimeloyl-ACP methyl ester carboxylesterase
MSKTTTPLPPLHTVLTPTLSIAYHDTNPNATYGSTSAPPIILLHGFPYTPHQYARTTTLLLNVDPSLRIIIPYLRGYHPTRYLHTSTLRSGQQAVLAYDLLQFMDALSLESVILAGYDWGGRAACIVAALHPERVAGLVSCGGYAIQNVASDATAVPSSVSGPGGSVEALRKLWYQFYFNTPQGEIGLRENRGAICRFLWETWSPDWKFSEEEWEESLRVFEGAGEDFVRTVIHSYRVRYDNVPGDDDPTVQEWERKCAERPKISVPTFNFMGKSDGVRAFEAEDKGRNMFTGWYERIDLNAVGHCPPAEAPKEFADGILKLLDVMLGRDG